MLLSSHHSLNQFNQTHMKKTPALILFIALAAFLFTGCEADPADILMDGPWTFDDISHDSEDQVTAAFIAIGEGLLEDATIEFFSDGTYTIIAPLTDPMNGAWDLIDGVSLTMDPDDEDDSSNATIVELKKKSLIYTENEVDFSMEAYTITTSWVRE
jgi:hypothetical protein